MNLERFCTTFVSRRVGVAEVLPAGQEGLWHQIDPRLRVLAVACVAEPQQLLEHDGTRVRVTLIAYRLNRGLVFSEEKTGLHEAGHQEDRSFLLLEPLFGNHWRLFVLQNDRWKEPDDRDCTYFRKHIVPALQDGQPGVGFGQHERQ